MPTSVRRPRPPTASGAMAWSPAHDALRRGCVRVLGSGQLLRDPCRLLRRELHGRGHVPRHVPVTLT